jgi:diguanylate cyclase (GGDEF)-like protein/PAS domain S-box-containing protein
MQTALAGVCLGVALILQPWIPGAVGDHVSAQEIPRWLMAIGTVAVVGNLVRRLADSLRDRDARFHHGFDHSPLGMGLLSTDMRLIEVNDAFAHMLGRTREDMAGMSILDITFPEDREASRGYRDEGVAEQHTTWSLEKRYMHADGSAVPVRVNTSYVQPGGGAPYFFTQVEDITDRRRHEAELDRRARQQQAVARLGQVALRGSGTLDDLAGEVVRTVASMLGTELSAVLELCHTEQTLTFISGVGWDDEIAARARFSVAEPDTQVAFTLAHKQPVVVEDLATETRFRHSAHLGAHGVTSGLTVVIEGHERPFGVLAAHTSERRTFTADDTHFVQAVANVLSTAVERRRVEEQTRHAALHDELTGLPNRRLVLDRIGQALQRRGEGSASVAVLLVDLDRFKVINDSLGHAAGDELLLALAPRLKAAMRPQDTVARLGGDEFVVVCEGLVSPRDAVAVAERIAPAIAQPVTLASGEHLVSASVGIAVGRAGDTPESLLRDADAAMYRAKERGRGRYELFDEPMREQVMRRLRTENELRRAVDGGELRVHYQPIVELPGARPVGVEALVRWQHPERGLLAPGEFIGVAEESGLIWDVGLFVLRESTRQVAEWQRPLGMPLRLSVNVSGRQIAKPSFPSQVSDIARAAELAPGTLALEITESVLLEEATAPMTVLGDLRDRGLRVVLDDFGTGYSSLSYLQRFPLDGLKIDRSFVANLGSGAGDGAAIVDAVARMAKSLGLEVVAEGIETDGQAALVASLGCSLGQGYLFAAPMPAERMAAYLAGFGVVPA